MNSWAATAMHPDTNQSNQRIVDDAASSSERAYALMTHLAPLVGFAALGGVPGVSVIAPLILWQIRKKDSPFLDDHGREAVNFQISLLIISIASCGILWLPAIIFSVITNIMAAVAANKGEFYRYPCCIRLLG